MTFLSAARYKNPGQSAMKVAKAANIKPCYIEAQIEVNAGNTDLFYVVCENKTRTFWEHPLELKGMKSYLHSEHPHILLEAIGFCLKKL